MIINNYQYGKNCEKVVKEDRDVYFIRIVFRRNVITVNILGSHFSAVCLNLNNFHWISCTFKRHG